MSDMSSSKQPTRIRRLTRTDLPTLAEFGYSVSITEPHEDLGRVVELFETTGFWQPESGAVAIVTNEGADEGSPADGGTMVGTLQFYRSAPCIHGIEIGYVVHDPAVRGRGYAASALQQFSDLLFEERPAFYRQQLLIGVWNTPSWKVAERCGFLREGVLRSCGFGEGDPGDSLIYSRTRKDYEHSDGV